MTQAITSVAGPPQPHHCGKLCSAWLRSKRAWSSSDWQHTSWPECSILSSMTLFATCALADSPVIRGMALLSQLGAMDKGQNRQTNFDSGHSE